MKTGQIYKIEVDGELLYIGSTTNMRVRKNAHKTCCFNESYKEYNKSLYQTIRSKNITRKTFKYRVKMIWICDVEFNKRYELGAVEAHYIKELNPICNCNIPYDKEWDQKQYNQDNKDKISKQKKQYYQDNKDKRKEYQKQYNQDNKDEIKDYQKQYRRSDKSKKYCIFCKYNYDKTPSDWKKHTKTAKHKKNCITFIDDVIDTIECRLIHV